MLVKLLKYSLFNIPLQPDIHWDEVDWNLLIEESRRQAVTALLYDAIQKSEGIPIPKQQLFHLYTLTKTIEQDYTNREDALKTLSSLIKNETGIDTTIVKGCSIARYYPIPQHRESGDNDLYMGARSSKVDELLKSKGISVAQHDLRHSTFRFHGVTFENHAYLMYPRKAGDTSCELDWKTVPLEDNIHRLIPEQEAYFLAAHIDRHATFFNESINLRKLIDWALLIKSGKLDYKRFNEIKKNSEIDRFADLLTQYCILTFGIAEPEGFHPLSQATLNNFGSIYLSIPERHAMPWVRVWRRCVKYTKYHKAYKEIYGQNPFARFYWRNIILALSQMILCKERKIRQ